MEQQDLVSADQGRVELPEESHEVLPSELAVGTYLWGYQWRWPEVSFFLSLCFS
jgi:hypothetical protein